MPSHPPFPQEDQLQETGTICATNPKIGSRQRWHKPKNCSKYPPPHYPPPQSQTPRGAGNWLKRGKTILCSNQTSLQGTGLFWLTRDRGGEKNTRWNHSYLKGWADGRKSCHWLNIGKHGLLCKVIPTLHLRVWLLFKKLHANFGEHQIQDPNRNNLLLRFSIFNSLRGKNTTKRITLLIVYIILIFSVQKKPTQSLSLFYSKN